MVDLRDWLLHGPMLADGAWGTELQRRGLAAGRIPDLWNLEHPTRVADVARAYSDAGSQIILTNTFRSNAAALPARDIAALNAAGVALSRQGAGPRVRIVGSIGPSGKLLVTGEVEETFLFDAFQEQAVALAEAGVHALLVETMSDLEEASLALRAARFTQLPVIVSFVFDSGKNKDRTMMGATPEQAAQRMEAEGAAAVGANCGAGIEAFVPVCRRLRAATSLPVWIKPNAGLPTLAEGTVSYSVTPEEFAAHVPALVEAGADFLGGCCGTTPDFIRAMAQRLASCA
jgi:methionine synthase I (cobalamin-dependent)